MDVERFRCHVGERSFTIQSFFKPMWETTQSVENAEVFRFAALSNTIKNYVYDNLINSLFSSQIHCTFFIVQKHPLENINRVYRLHWTYARRFMADSYQYVICYFILSERSNESSLFNQCAAQSETIFVCTSALLKAGIKSQSQRLPYSISVRRLEV